MLLADAVTARESKRSSDRGATVGQLWALPPNLPAIRREAEGPKRLGRVWHRRPGFGCKVSAQDHVEISRSPIPNTTRKCVYHM